MTEDLSYWLELAAVRLDIIERLERERDELTRRIDGLIRLNVRLNADVLAVVDRANATEVRLNESIAAYAKRVAEARCKLQEIATLIRDHLPDLHLFASQ